MAPQKVRKTTANNTVDNTADKGTHATSAAVHHTVHCLICKLSPKDTGTHAQLLHSPATCPATCAASKKSHICPLADYTANYHKMTVCMHSCCAHPPQHVQQQREWLPPNTAQLWLWADHKSNHLRMMTYMQTCCTAQQHAPVT
jgi:hypothetical protein